MSLLGIAGWTLAGLGIYELSVQSIELTERHHYFNLARRYCDSVGKPLLRIGVRRSFLEPPNGDVTLDIDPIITSIPGGVLADERAIPYPDRYFGVAFNEHTLEHLHSAEDVGQAVAECVRVADYAIFLCPSPYSLIAMLHHDHYLRLWFDPASSSIQVVSNSYRLPMDIPHPPALARVGGIRVGAAREVGQVLIARGTRPRVLTQINT